MTLPGIYVVYQVDVVDRRDRIEVGNTLEWGSADPGNRGA